MAVEAPYAKYNRSNFKIGIAICIVLAIWCTYDGYFNDKWIEEHTDTNGNPETYLVFNRKAPPYFIGAAVFLGAYLLVVRNKKVVLDESNLVVAKRNIACDSIEKIDETYFKSKGYFVITYKDEQGNEAQLKLSDKTYDNLSSILEGLVAKIS
jgi:hypothetical protein